MRVAFTVGALALAITMTTARAQPADPTVGLFAQNAAISNEFEIAESKIILEDSTNPALRAFAQQMITDHGKAQAMLRQAGARVDVPTGFMLDRLNQKSVDDLGLMDGKRLDDTYVADQVAAHATAAANLSGYLATGSDPVLRAYAGQALPVVLHHQRMLEQMTGQAAPL